MYRNYGTYYISSKMDVSCEDDSYLHWVINLIIKKSKNSQYFKNFNNLTFFNYLLYFSRNTTFYCLL